MILLIFLYLFVLFIKNINNLNLIIIILLINLFNFNRIEWIFIFCNFTFNNFAYDLIILTLWVFGLIFLSLNNNRINCLFINLFHYY